MRSRPAALGCAALTLLAYLPSLSNGFVDWDDEKYLLASREHLGFGLAQLKWMATTTFAGNYMPLSWLSFALDYRLWGPQAWAFHLTSAVLHAANAALVFLLARELLADKDDWRAPALAALLFSLHPLRVESVAWVFERRDVLCGFFYLLSVLLYVKCRVKESLAAFAAALLSKGMAVTLPVVLCLLDLLALKRRAWGEKVPFFALALAVGLLGWRGQADLERESVILPGLGGRLAQAAYGLVFYAGKTLWPSRLAPLYFRPPGMSLSQPLFLACAVAATGTTILSFVLFKRRPRLAAAWLCYAVMLTPVLGLVAFGRQLAADRYSYLPCVPWALLAAAGLRRRPWAGGVLVAALAALTLRQLPVWRDSVSLWARVTEVAPEQAMPRNSLGYALAARRRFPEAAEQYRRAIEFDASYELPRNNLGNLLAAEGRLPEAEAEYRQAVALKPGYWEARSNLGLALARQNRLKEAAAELEAAARIKPEAAGVRKNLGLVYLSLGRKAEAAEQLRAAESLRYRPQ